MADCTFLPAKDSADEKPGRRCRGWVETVHDGRDPRSTAGILIGWETPLLTKDLPFREGWF